MTTPPIRRLSANVGVTSQITPDDVAAIAAAGYRSILNNRPDHEGGPGQPTTADVAAAAAAAGLSYAHQPVSPAVQTPDDIAAFAALLATLPTPVLAYCRSGTRSTRLWTAAQAGDAPGG